MNYLTLSGVFLQLILSIVNRFIYKLPDWLHIPLMILGLVLLIAGFLLEKKS